MKRAAAGLLLTVSVFALSSCGSLRGARMTEGAVIGAGLGALIGASGAGGKGAAIGAAAGAGVGTLYGLFTGSQEEAIAYTRPLPLEALIGKSVAVIPHPNYGAYSFNITKPVIEEQLRLRGAGAIYNMPQYPQADQLRTVNLAAEVLSDEQYGAVRVNIRLLEAGTGRVVAFGAAREFFGQPYGYYGHDFRIEAAATASKKAVWEMKPM